MATFGLRINRGPTLNLSGIFKAAMPDPDLAIKAALANSTIWGQEHQNKLYDASAEEKRQLALKAAQEQAILEAQQAAKDAAAAPYGQVLADAINDPDAPIPVQPPVLGGNRGGGNLLAPGFLESRPAIVSSEAEEKYKRDLAIAEHQRAYQRVAGPAIVQLAKDASDYASGTGKGLGAAIVAGNPTPERARAGAMLYTGNIPGKDSVAAAGDFAGVDASTREAVQTAAGKLPYDIAAARDKAQAEAEAKVAARPLGDTETAIYRAKMAELEAKPPGQWTPEEKALYPLLKAAVDKANAVTPGEKGPIYLPGEDGFNQVGGPAVDPNAPTPAYPGDSVKAANKNIIDEVTLDMALGRPIDLAKAVHYQTAFDDEWPEKATVIKNADGTTQMFEATPAPAGRPTKAAVFAAARLSAQGGPAPAGGVAAPVPAEIARLGTPPAGMVAAPTLAEQTTGQLSPLAKVPPSATEGEAKDQTFALTMQDAAINLNTFNKANMPSGLEAAQIQKDMATVTDPSLLSAYLETQVRNSILSPAAKAYEQAIANWTSEALYKFSGSALTYGEWVRQQVAMAPTFGDEDDLLLRKAKLRSNIIKSFAKNGWARDKAAYDEFIANTLARGLDLTYGLGADPPVTIGPRAATPATPAAAASPEEDADRKQPPPRTRTKGLENTDDKVWEKIYRKLPWSIRQKLRAAG